MSKQDFYIGYFPQMPNANWRVIRVFLVGMFLLALVAAFVMVKGQRDFSTATFELGQLSVVSGILTTNPVPLLQVNQGQDIDGQAVIQSILLIGFGKHGAEAALEAYAAEKKVDLEGKMLTLEGTLIYHDGKTLLELTNGPESVLQVEPTQPLRRNIKRLQTFTLVGEIADPKCYFGVMKPGEGKVHRSCAALCIAGGIPPVLKTRLADGSTQYLLLKGKEGQAINERVLAVVGEAVQLSGQVVQYDDWLALQWDETAEIQRLGTRLMLDVPMCGEGLLGALTTK
ncbi:MAG: hypothetical protein R2828_11635 [Saprospiraceae bacterium]